MGWEDLMGKEGQVQFWSRFKVVIEFASGITTLIVSCICGSRV